MNAHCLACHPVEHGTLAEERHGIHRYHRDYDEHGQRYRHLDGHLPRLASSTAYYSHARTPVIWA